MLPDHKNEILPKIREFVETLEPWKPFVAKIQGSTLEEKYSNFINRLKKVDENCSELDSDYYRQEFCYAHAWVESSIITSTSTELGVSDDPEWGLYNTLYSIIGQFNSKHTNESNGFKDGLAILALEIFSILEG